MSENPLIESNQDKNFEKILSEIDESAIECSEYDLSRKQDQRIQELQKIVEVLSKEKHKLSDEAEQREMEQKIHIKTIQAKDDSIKGLKSDYEALLAQHKKDMRKRGQEIQELNSQISHMKDRKTDIEDLKAKNEELLKKVDQANLGKRKAQEKAETFFLKWKELEEKGGSGPTEASQSQEMSREVQDAEEEDIDDLRSVIDKRLTNELEKNLWKSVDYSSQLMFLNNLAFWTETKIEDLQENHIQQE